MEEAHTFLSRPPNFVSLQKLQEERLKEKREKEEEEERQQRLAKEEEERKKIDEQQKQEREERIRKSNGKKKSHKQLKIRDESSSKSQDQEDVKEPINGSEKSKQKKKKEWTKRKIERKNGEAAKDEIQNAVEKAVGEEKESGDDHKEKLEANWVWRKKSVHKLEMVKRIEAITPVSGGDEIKKSSGEVDVSPNLVTEADMVKKIEAITVTSGDGGLVKKEKKRHERTVVNRGSGGSRYGRKMVGTSSRIDENLIWVKKEQATGQKTGLRFN